MKPDTVKDHPILFTGPMVNAILQGRKSQTRRPLYVTTKNVKSAHFHRDYPPNQSMFGQAMTLSHWFDAKPGERLWVRETCMFSIDAPAAAVAYKADGFVRGGLGDFELERWRPSIHMPRWACRIHLEITDVRVERLQDISEADAVAEGAEPIHHGVADSMMAAMNFTPLPYTSGYARLWESINGPGSWEANPWVVVIEFKRADQ
jgi:hypothetical protein